MTTFWTKWNMTWHLGFVKSQNKTNDENLNDDDDEHGDTVASFHTLKCQPIQAKKRTL